MNYLGFSLTLLPSPLFLILSQCIQLILYPGLIFKHCPHCITLFLSPEGNYGLLFTAVRYYTWSSLISVSLFLVLIFWPPLSFQLIFSTTFHPTLPKAFCFSKLMAHAIFTAWTPFPCSFAYPTFTCPHFKTS